MALGRSYAILSGVTWHLQWVIRVPQKRLGGCVGRHTNPQLSRNPPRALYFKKKSEIHQCSSLARTTHQGPNNSLALESYHPQWAHELRDPKVGSWESCVEVT